MKLKPAYAVIGANYGDEGKGLTVDYLARTLSHPAQDDTPVVARCNGGGQAGHTVVTDEHRHVFSHVGAGTFAGSDTYLSRNFILNPYTFAKEVASLSNFLDGNSVAAHAGCRVTTIFDMALNGLRELSRGDQRHGSCGLGINETVNRDNAGHRISLVDVHSMSETMMALHLEVIFKQYWKPAFSSLPKWLANMEEAKTMLDVFANDDFCFHASKLAPLKTIRMTHPFDSPAPSRALIVEGAQGLALDETLGKFPHVTRSITGLPSALLAAHELGYREINPIYVTRAYNTRHGAGPLRNDGDAFTNVEVPPDQTNVTGMWQGHFRTAPLNIHQMKRLIEQDMGRSHSIANVLGIKINKPTIMLTHFDEMGETVATRRHGGHVVWSLVSELPSLIEQTVGVKVKYISRGPTASDVDELN